MPDSVTFPYTSFLGQALRATFYPKMKNKKSTYQVAIVGGGPVGLFLGCLLESAGISCVILEKRESAVTHSRSIGIHPVSLELFNTISLAEPFINKGTKVKEGMAFIGSDHIGTLSFASCPPPYPFILTLPQYKTERLLASHLNSLNPEILRRGTSVTQINETENAVELRAENGGDKQTITAAYVVGCDGKNSFVRRGAFIPFPEKAYRDTYIMGDFTDNTDWGSKAAIFLCKQGLIESFPLSDKVRRWVVKTDQYRPEISREYLEKKIADRINHRLDGTANSMLSSFGVQKGLAKTMAKRRIILAGDSAHLVSPIGGQGMNLGWLDARDLADCFVELFGGLKQPDKILQAYSNRRLKIAKKVIRRAEFNMVLGRKTKVSFLKRIILWPLLKTPLSTVMARMFTMRGLKSSPV